MISSAGRSRARFVCATSSHYRQVLHLVHSRICNALQPQSCLQHAGSLCRAAPRMPMEKRMPQHRPTLVPAIFALPLAASCVVSAGAVHAAECIAKPNAPAQQGKHWYYRTDRATKRQCWYLGSQGASVQKGATQASEQPAPNALAQPAAPQRAHRPTAPQSAQRPTAPELTAALAATEASVPAPAAPLPLPEASELPDVPPAFELAPTPALAERQQSVDAIDPAPTPASDPAKESQSPANARSSPVTAPAQATDDADHTLALAMIVFVTIAISGSVLEVTRWLRRRKASNRRELEWATSNTLYQCARASLDFDSRIPALHIPPPPKPLGQAETLAQNLQQILNELQTRPYVSQSSPSDLPRSSWPPVATSTLPDPTR